MADITEAIKRLTYLFTSDGADKVASDMKAVNDAGTKLTAGTISVSEQNLSLDKSFAGLERRYVTAIRNDQDFAKVKSTLNDAVKQNPALQDRANVVLAAAAERYGQAGVAARAFSAATSGVSGQLIALSAGAGPVGVFLAALGPWGLAAAAGIGLLMAAFEKATSLANAAIQLEKFSETTGLATDQLQALTQAAARHGVQAQDTISAIQRFTAAWDELRNGSGTMLDQIRKVDGGLADQMQRTTDVTQALNLLVRAIQQYDAAGNIASRNQLLRSAGGRGGIGSLTGVAEAVNQAGGIQGLTAQTAAQGGIVDPALLTRLRDLQTEIDETRKRTEEMLASMNAESLKKIELAWVQLGENGAKALKKLNDEQSNMNWFQKFFDNVNRAEQEYAKMGAAPAASSAKPSWLSSVQPPSNYAGGIGNPLDSINPGGTFTLTGNLTPQAISEQWKTYTAALGPAASATEKLQAKLADLFAQYSSGKITVETYNRAVSGENLQTTIQLEGQRIGLLGEAASVTDLLKQKQDLINKARLEGVKITSQESSVILASVAAQRQSSDTQILTANNVVTAETLRATKLAELNVLLGQHKLTQDQVNISAKTYEKTIRETIEAQQVQKSLYPQLTQLMLDSGNSYKQIDNFATSSLNNLVTALDSIVMHTSSAKDAFRNLGTQVLSSLDQMVIKMAIVQPIAAALQATLAGTSSGGFNFLSFLGLGGSSSSVASGIAGKEATSIAHSGGVIGSDSFAGRYVHPAYFENAPRFHSGGTVGADEVPIIARKGEGVFTPAQMAAMGGGGSSISVTNHNDFRGADPNSEARIRAALAQQKQDILRQIVPMVDKAKSQQPGLLRTARQ